MERDVESVVYVSRSEIDPSVADEAVATLVSAAQRSNVRRGLTGGLIFTRRHFAQVLEGETAQLNALLPRLSSDARHSAVTVIARRPIKRRFFFDWSLAYSGQPLWVDDHIETLFESLPDHARPETEARVAQLMVQFALLRRCAR